MASKTPAPLPAAIESLFVEADRRFATFGVRDGKKLSEAWIGLGMPSEYKPAVVAGLMAPLHGRETPRCMSWYLFTAAGVKAYRQWKAAGDYRWAPMTEAAP